MYKNGQNFLENVLHSLVWFVYESEFGTNRAKTYI